MSADPRDEARGAAADRLPDPATKGWSNVPAKPIEQSSAQTRKVLTGNGPPVPAAVSPAEPPEADDRPPTAITGTWSDMERHALYLYDNPGVAQASEWELAEAVLVLLRTLDDERRITHGR